jgi:hypothetical protein
MVYFQTKNPALGKFWRTLEWKMLVYFVTIWNILRPFGIIYGRLVKVVCGNLVYFYQFGMFGPRKIWQPCFYQSKGTLHKYTYRLFQLRKKCRQPAIHVHNVDSNGFEVGSIFFSLCLRQGSWEFKSFFRVLKPDRARGVAWQKIRVRIPSGYTFFKEVARGGERTRILSISFIFSFSPLYRWATAAPPPPGYT